jgi:RNA polymerase sigma-70 factor (ECF subfamily)
MATSPSPARRAEPPRPALPGDAELVSRARGGDRWARGVLYQRYAPNVAAMLGRLLGDRDEALDLLHDAYVYAFENLGALREDDRFRAWLFQIAVSQSRSRLRRRKLLRALGLVSVEGSLDGLCHGASPETHAELARIDRALARMSVDERIAWCLKHVEGCSMPEVAAHVGCSLSTAKRRVDAAEQRIARHVAGETEGS